MNKTFDLVVLCNDEETLTRNLLASELAQASNVMLQVRRDARAASFAYNQALDQGQAPIVIFAHQDVYFPPSWLRRLELEIEKVEMQDQNWAVIAPIGMSHQAKHVGQVWSTGLGALVGRELHEPEPVQSVDELVIVLRRDANIRFDDKLPEFHLFGSDIVQTALAMGKGAYACQLPLVHNDQFHDNLRSDFHAAYQYMRRKWRAMLPLRTTVLWISTTGLDFTYYRLAARRSRKARRDKAMDVMTDPREYSRRCGWEP